MNYRKMSTHRLFVLDTNVLMHDPSAIFRFEEHDVYLPMVVIEELDRAKKGTSEVARNVRQASRFLDELIHNATHENITDGLSLQKLSQLNPEETESAPSGRVFLQTESLSTKLPDNLPGTSADNTIIATALTLQRRKPELTVTLVSKDINLRIKAAMVGLNAEDYFNDRVIDDLDLLHSGCCELPDNFWEEHNKDLESWQEEGRTFYRITGPITQEWYPNCFLHLPSDEGFKAIVRENGYDGALVELVDDFSSKSKAIWGINARNMEQNFAFNMLLDPKIDFVSILGAAGTGKTLLALAAGLTQTLEMNRYREIIMTRATVPVGDDIGFLPGTEEEKMAPWMGALLDNLEVLTGGEHDGDWERSATNDLLRSRISIKSLNFMRGRTFINKYLIIDEAQNLTPKQMQTLITRAGYGTKIICLGNLSQIDTPYLTESTSGLTSVVDKFKTWDHGAHITLTKGERSRLADFASESL